MRDRRPGADGAGVSGRAGRGYQPPDLTAAGASPAAAQRRVVTRVADRSLWPAGGRRPAVTAAGALCRGPGRARRADRAADGGEVARPFPSAAAADRARQLVAVHADIRLPAAGAQRNRGGLPADPAPAPAAGMAAAGLAQRAARLVVPCHGPDLPAARAFCGQLTAPAAGAHPAARGGGQRPAAPPAAPARRLGQGHRAARDQLGNQATDRRRGPVRQCPGIRSQPSGHITQCLRAGDHRVHSGRDHRDRQGPLCRRHLGRHLGPAAGRAGPAPPSAARFVSGPADGGHPNAPDLASPGPGADAAAQAASAGPPDRRNQAR
jgi:hypothetical protein